MDPKILQNIVKLYGTIELKQTSIKRKNRKNYKLNEDDYRIACNVILPCIESDCDKLTVNRRIEYRLVNHNQNLDKYWIKKCIDCGKRTTIFPRNKTK